jgi:hypothetical protein
MSIWLVVRRFLLPLCFAVLQVAAFLSPLHPAWDLSLMFVMGGALLVALPGEGGGGGGTNGFLSIFVCFS